jgi:hypothetical protein
MKDALKGIAILINIGIMLSYSINNLSLNNIDMARQNAQTMCVVIHLFALLIIASIFEYAKQKEISEGLMWSILLVLLVGFGFCWVG